MEEPGGARVEGVTTSAAWQPAAPASERSHARRRARRRARTLLLSGAHLFVLSAFALAQPLFDLLSRNAAFFAVRGSTRSDILVFAFGVLLLPPVVLLLVEAVALAARVLVWRAAHLVFVAALSALIVLQVVQRVASNSGVTLLIVAALAGAGLAACYLHLPAVRTFLTVLLPAPLIFTALFLFNSPVTKLLSAEEETAAATAKVESETPIVLVVFDELATVSLLDARGRIDAKRFPNFAELAGDATFYRDATTVHTATEHAVPSILTGRLPRQDELPITLDHPRNLFTFLGRSYRQHAFEALTHICPRRLCTRSSGARAELGPEAGDSFASDISIVYLHVLLPDSLAEHLPAIDRSWRDFRGAAVAAERKQPASEQRCVPVCRMVRTLGSTGPGTLHYFHALVPHMPWRYLPSGKVYLGDTLAVPGLSGSVWQGDEFLAMQAYIRYLLQVGFTDRALGLILDRLRETGAYDDSLVVVVADHGLSFEAGEPRRNVTEGNLDELAFVPLFVKLPNQERGRVQGGFARTIDVLPTIADALGARLPWRVAGRSLLRRRPPTDGVVAVMGSQGQTVERQLSQLVVERAEELRRQVETFGVGSWDSLYRAGPLGGLVGQRLDDLGVGDADGLSLDLDGRAAYGAVDPKSPLVPAFVTGRVHGAAPGWDLAVALNGRIAATARTYDSLGETRFAAMMPETALRAGRNDVAVLVVGDGGSSLEKIESTEPALRLEGSVIRRVDGGVLAVDTASIRGELRVSLQDGRIDLAGWAADLERGSPVDAVVVFVDGALRYTAEGQGFRRRVPEEKEGVEGVGFGFALPENLLPAKGSDQEVRVFALSAGRAAELRYELRYPWRY
jgi:Sulfatase